MSEIKSEIKLREDGWFEAGKNARNFAKIVYKEKQRIKQELEQLSEKNLGYDELKEAIQGIEGKRPAFKGSIYLRGKDLMIETPGLPGECYLGKIEVEA